MVYVWVNFKLWNLGEKDKAQGRKYSSVNKLYDSKVE